ncbi:MAG TPA: 5'-nucleotidase [Bdellovibrionales bacterium]|nr:5'-nucleotidase [Pseudobdellovibrionaceae bacterium]HAG90711.1 5'-nucleotidase [Bdellovibrionales bacterium]|tara:strand:+ start:576 stop:1949 length:1374 start_codon:yes stop_codon:yes gene_type:complete
MHQNVFANRTLNLKRILYLGFDMDHTLVRYNSENFESLAHQTMLKKLVEMKSYPEEILKLEFSFDRAIRGLVIDKVRGNVLKLSRHAGIRVSYHGLKPIDYREQRKIYGSTYVDLRDPDYDTVDTTFSIAFAGLFMQLVDLKDKRPELNFPDYQIIANDLNSVLDRAHRDGSLKDRVRENLEHFIVIDEEVVQGLERFRLHGKKLFVLTNSDFSYTKLLLDYCINPCLKNHSSWEELFEYTITLAAKPRFFTERISFLKVDPKSGLLSNCDEPLSPGIYQGGHAQTFTQALQADPNDILYIGDHIYGDIVRLKKDCAWRTALVIEELAAEVEKNKEASPINGEIDLLMNQKIPLETKVDELISEQIESGTKNHEKKIQELLQKVNKTDQAIAAKIRKLQKIYNPYWGEVMRAGIEESYFGYQVDRFACVYMSKLSDLLTLSPRTYFRSVKKPLAHDL